MLKKPYAKRLRALPVLVGTLGLGLLPPDQVVAHDSSDHNLLDPVCQDPLDMRPAGRRRPGDKMPEPAGARPCNPDAMQAPSQDQVPQFVDIPSRWRIVEAVGVPNNYFNPYSGNNPLKGDRPMWGDDWFLNLSATSTTLLEPRRVPLVRSSNGTAAGGKAETGEQFFFRQDLAIDVTVYKGDTVFRPPDWAFRFNPVATLRETSGEGKSFTDNDWAVQNMYVEKHLNVASDNYDYDQVRFGIQNFNADWRGFLMADQPMGLRFFGTRANNVFQYNLAWFRPWEKHETTGLNKVEDRLKDHDIFLANLYWQDALAMGLNSQFTVAYSRSRERGVRISPNGAASASFRDGASHDFDVVYLGYNTDGHVGRLNLSGSMYGVLGSEEQGQFTGSHSDVAAFFAALEASMDFDWVRVRLSGMHASGDDDPYDDDSEGFDSIRDNPMFAGADTSFYMRQRLLLPGGAVNLSRRNSFFNGFRPEDDSGQASFTNPGFNLLGVGMDFDVLPELRVSFNANQMWFDETQALEAVMGEGSIGHNIGQDLSLSTIYRPLNNQNIIMRMSGAVLIPGQGYRDMYDSKTNYSIQGSLLLRY